MVQYFSTKTGILKKRLSQLTWTDMRDQMSIAGNPEKVTEMGKQIEQMIGSQLDNTNRAEMTNIEFMLKRLVAEVKTWQKMYDSSH